MPRVQILLSTYNGARYLPEQLQSLRGQDHRDIEILVRDDGSRDGTCEVLNRFSGDRRVRIAVGENLGIVRSFFELLCMSSADAEYVAFCDQDDVWLPDKISRALCFLKSSNAQQPTIYVSRVIVVDEQLRRREMSPEPSRPLALGNALVENVFPGCTMVLNRAARDLIVARLPRFALMHDWWIYLVMSACGEIRYDEESRILYRQHAQNVVGVPSGVRRKAWRRVSRFMRRKERILWQVEEFKRLYADRLSSNQLETVDMVTRAAHGLASRFALAFSSRVYRQAPLDDLLLRLVTLANRL